MTDHVTPRHSMGATAAHESLTTATATRVLAVITAALLAVDAYVHLAHASQYDSFKSSVMSEGTLFRIQGVVAIVVAVAVLIWPRILTWVLSILVSGSAAVTTASTRVLVAVLLHRDSRAAVAPMLWLGVT